jgi:hypothetical protein
MLNALISVGGVLVGALIASAVWLLGGNLVEFLGKAKHKTSDPTFHHIKRAIPSQTVW